MAQRGKVICLPNDQFIVAEAAVEWLQAHGFTNHLAAAQSGRCGSQRRYEILLPTRYNDGGPVEEGEICRDEARVGGSVWCRNYAAGAVPRMVDT